MVHQPNPTEQVAIDTLLERFDFEPVPVRLTSTMLAKSIIDATVPIRALLRRSGIIDFGAMPKGEEGKVQIQIPFVSAEVAEHRRTSFYRPNTKDGDPRFWISSLSSIANEGDLLVVAFYGVEVAALLVGGNVDALSARASLFLPSRFDERGQVERTVTRLNRLLAPIRSKWIPTQRAGPTGVGYTLESILGISANARPDADIDGVELKAYRRGALTGDGKLVTLFAKTPQWLGIAKGAGLLDAYGYHDAERGRHALYCTIMRTRNSLGWNLKLEPELDRVGAAHHGETVVAYSMATLEKRLREKHPATLFVKATARGGGSEEQFRYDDVVLCRQPSLANFISLIDENKVGLDFTLHRKKNGKTRDHGYLWRVREYSIPSLYAYRREVGVDE